MKGIIFTEPMFRAAIEGRKTQTRRILNPQPKDIYDAAWNRKPRYNEREKVYIKEPYFFDEYKNQVAYKYYPSILPSGCLNGYYYKNKLFMPAKYARYFIEITSVRCERVQNISDDDCRKEGIEEFKGAYLAPQGCHIIPDYGNISSPKNAYAALFDKINGKGSWDSNPYVWVYTYKLKTITFDEILEDNKDVLMRLKNI